MVPCTSVIFRFDGVTTSGQVVYLIGDGILGNWRPQDSIKMTKKISKQNPKHSYWEATIKLERGYPVNYKYLIKGKDRMIKWETRKEEHRSIIPEGDEMVINDTYLTNDENEVWLTEGWLTSEIQIRIELGYNDPLTGAYYEPVVWENPSDQPRTVWLHFYYNDQVISHDIVKIPITKWTEVVFHTDDIENFKIIVEFYQDDNDSLMLLGKSVIRGKNLMNMRGLTSAQIFSTELESIGELNFKYLVIKPFQHKLNNLSAMMNSLATKPTGKKVGHRGCGSSKTTHISENTLLSFLTAAQYGADFIEFDIQMTKDKVPVIHHDFSVCMINEDKYTINTPISSLTKSQFKLLHPMIGFNFKEMEYLKKRPLKKSRSFTDLQAFKSKWRIDHSETIDQNVKDFHMPMDVIPKGIVNIRDTHATLAETLRTIPVEVGFVVEIKYPSERYMVRENIRYHERNVYVDTVLKTIFNALENPLVSKRKIMLISFDPDICILLAQKQPRYPVFLLLSLGKGMPITSDDDEVEGYDQRCNSFETAIYFAKKIRLAGVILDALYIINNPEKVQEAHNLGLTVMTYGVQNMKESDRDLQKQAGVDSFIMDNFVHIGNGLRKKNRIPEYIIAQGM